MKPSTAATLNKMMQAVITGGTATGVQIPGITWAGKTGTAETNEHGVYDAWFIFFAPADHPVVAGAVVIEHSAAVSAAPWPPRSPNSSCRRSFPPRRSEVAGNL